MGVADAIPGVSGGTIAFISGIYERLIGNLRALSGELPGHLLRGQWRAAFQSLHLSFFLPLLIGIGVAIVGMSRVLTLIFSSEVLRTALLALFCGLVIASAYTCGRRVLQWSRSRWIALIGGAIAAFLFIGLLEGRGEPLYNVQLSEEIEEISQIDRAANYQPLGHLVLDTPKSKVAALVALGKISPDALVYSQQEERWGVASQFVPVNHLSWLDLKAAAVGMVAACAMLLPGISGAFLLHMAGYYEAALIAVAGLSQGEFGGLPLLLNLACGFLVGIALFARAIHWLFARYADLTTALLTGLMIGALRSLWPFWSYRWVVDPLRFELLLDPIGPIVPDFHRPLFWGVLFIAFQGALLLLLIEAIAHRISRDKAV